MNVYYAHEVITENIIITSTVFGQYLSHPQFSPVAGSRTSKSSFELLFSGVTRWPLTKCSGLWIAADPVATERVHTDCSSVGTRRCQQDMLAHRVTDGRISIMDNVQRPAKAAQTVNSVSYKYNQC